MLPAPLYKLHTFQIQIFWTEANWCGQVGNVCTANFLKMKEKKKYGKLRSPEFWQILWVQNSEGILTRTIYSIERGHVNKYFVLTCMYFVHVSQALLSVFTGCLFLGYLEPLHHSLLVENSTDQHASVTYSKGFSTFRQRLKISSVLFNLFGLETQWKQWYARSFCTFVDTTFFQSLF